MHTDKLFTKNMISWQCTIVKFRNEMLGLAIRDKISEDDNDGDEVFMIYDVESKSFIGSKRLCCYDDDLRNNLSTSGIFGYIDAVGNNQDTNKVKLNDTSWDVINVVVYPYALDAFQVLTSGEKLYWLYKIN